LGKGTKFSIAAIVGVLIVGCGGVSSKPAGIVVDESYDKTEQTEVVISLSGIGSVWYDGMSCELSDVSLLAKESETKRIRDGQSTESLAFIIVADQSTDNSLLVGVMSELSQVGVTNVRIEAQYPQ